MIKEEFIRPGLQFASKDFDEMTRYLVDVCYTLVILNIL